MSTRLTGVDIARGLALLGIIANHIFFFSHPTIATALQDFHAILFMLLAGVVFTYAPGKNPRLKNIVRGIICIVLGLALGAGNPRLDVILLNYGWLFIFGSFFVHKLAARHLYLLSVAWAVVMPFVGAVLRPLINYHEGPNIGFQTLASQPWLVFLDPVVYSMYPVMQWFAVFLFGAALGRTDIRALLSDTDKMFKTMTTAMMVFFAAKTTSIAALMLVSNYSLHESLIYNFSLGKAAVDLNTPDRLLGSAPYTSTTLALVSSTAIGIVIVMAGSLLSHRGIQLQLVQMMGMATLTLYSLHVFVHTVITPQWADNNSMFYYLLTIVGAGILVWTWHRYAVGRTGIVAPGPIEEVTRRIIVTENSKRERKSVSGTQSG